MLRFHFHLKDGNASPDNEGTVGKARAEALRVAGEMLTTLLPEDPFARQWKMKHTIEEAPERGPVLDAAIIAQYQRMTHYGITGFGTVGAFARR